MKLCSLDAPDLSQILDTLATACAGRTLSGDERVTTSGAHHSPTEGLALVGAYMAISDPAVRQAFLDLALMLNAKKA